MKKLLIEKLIRRTVAVVIARQCLNLDSDKVADDILTHAAHRGDMSQLILMLKENS